MPELHRTLKCRARSRQKTFREPGKLVSPRRMNTRIMPLTIAVLGTVAIAIITAGTIKLAHQLPDDPSPHPIFLEVVLDSEHHGQLLCTKPSAKFVPCTIEVRGDGWNVHFTEAKP